MNYCEIRRNVYYDSVTLMLFSSEIGKIDGIREAAVMMGTDHNRTLMQNAGLITEEQAGSATPNDMIIGIIADQQTTIDAARNQLEELFKSKEKKSGGPQESARAQTIEEGIRQLDGANMAVISVPGRFAHHEAMTALQKGLNVLLFSDNVSLEEEIDLKQYATAHDLLMMGPDCGTAIVNGVALGFANVVRRGPIGIAAASGTGLQELTCLIHRYGGGISQGLATGGRDLKEEVGGNMMMLELEALRDDPQTSVIGIIAKPPAKPVLSRILTFLKKCGKPSAVCFMGLHESEYPDHEGILVAHTIEELARVLTALQNGCSPQEAENEGRKCQDVRPLADSLRDKLMPGQKYIRGLYSGGTLAYEAMLLTEPVLHEVYSNISVHEEYLLRDPEISRAHTLLDMGEDYFTNGMPHPMIDMRLREKRAVREASDPQTAVILYDCVLGFGCHEDPAGELVRMTRRSEEAADGRHIIFIASVCGTDEDIQCRAQQVKELEDAGIIVCGSNAEAVRLAMAIVAGRQE